MKKIIIFFLFLVIMPNFLLTQNLKWNGELRVRGELDNRDFINKTPPNYYTLFRARLGAEYNPIEDLKFYFQVQDARVFGEEKDAQNNFNTISNTKNLDIHQAYIRVDNFLIENLMLKVGRQRLAYGNERLVGVVNWNNIGRIFDGGLLRYEFSKNQLDLFVMNTGETNIVPSAATPTDVRFVRDEGQLFSGINYTTKSHENQHIEFFTFHQLNRKVSVPGYNDLSRFTSGIHGNGKIIEQLSYNLDLAYQYGWRRGVDVSAYLVALTLGYEFKDMPLSYFSVSYERLSGTKMGDTKYKTFDPMYPTGHKFYGYMDYFINIPVHTHNLGLQDIYARFDFNLMKDVKANLTIHNFNLAEKMAGENGLGQEIDLVINWKYNNYLSFETGGGLFIPDKVMRNMFSANDVSQWGYLTMQFNF